MLPSVEGSGKKLKILHAIPQAIVLESVFIGPLWAMDCLAPQRPYVPADLAMTVEYADLIRWDFEEYIEDIQQHFRCLDEERARAFEEAQEVSQEYGRFLKALGNE